MTIQFDDDKQSERLAEFRKKEEEAFAQTLAARHSLPYIDLVNVPIEPDAVRLIPEGVARAAKVAPFGLTGKKVSVALLSPNREDTAAALTALEERGFEVARFIASTASLQKVWKRYEELSQAHETKAGALLLSHEEIAQTAATIHTIGDAKRLIDETIALKKAYRISRIVEVTVGGALATDASDIHIEPEEKEVRLRYRLDGVLGDVTTFDRETYLLLLSRVKLLSGLKLNVKEEPQDGRFSVRLRDSDIEIRTSVLPGSYGEAVVLRILNPKSIAVPLQELGIHPKLLGILLREIQKPNGMLLTTGPTGSGKTTTLYAFLKKVHKPEIKIITIEDPVEYHLPGIVQTQVESEKGYTFLEGLRSSLRQDPDVIMVGEIRDRETAEIAINSAQTGHLVFTTLHTNTAAGAFPRLIDLGVNPKVLTSAITVAMAQRLVRKLCTNCRRERAFSPDEKETVARFLKTLPHDVPAPKATHTYEAAGCPKCNNTGYRGRIGIYEAILTDKTIDAIIRESPSERDIRTAAAGQGIPTLEQDGILKVLAGITSFDELRRVVDIARE